MKFLILTVLTALTSLAQAELYWEASPLPPQFCMQNFNAYGPIYAGRVEERTDYIISYLKFVPKCEIVQLQEVWNSAQIDQLENALRPVFQMSTPNREERIGLMSFTMGEIVSRSTYQFRVNNEGSLLDNARQWLGVKKAFHVMRTRLFAVNEDLDLVNTHLHPTSAAVRIAQILDLLQWRLQNQANKFLLSGDFNADIHSTERKLILYTLGAHDAMEEALNGYPQGYCTYCAKNPSGWLNEDKVFDYIFFSNVGRTPTVLKATQGQLNMTGSERKPWSDHYGIRVQFSVESDSAPLRNVENSRGHAMQVFDEAAVILKKERSAEFRPYLALIQDLASQLKNRQGPFNQYFESYR